MFSCVKLNFLKLEQVQKLSKLILSINLPKQHLINNIRHISGVKKRQHDKVETVTEEDDPDWEGETDPFLRSEIKKYNLGKRWLARMMGEDPDNFNQTDIDAAIKYLLPSHLWAKDARPQMTHPHEIFPKSKESEFDEFGRPYSAAFYTGKPKFYDLTYQVWEIMEKLNSGVDIHNLTEPSTDEELSMIHVENNMNEGRKPQIMQWLKKFQLEQKIDEKMNDKLYDTILFRLKKLATHERSNEIQDFLRQYQVPIYTPGKEDLKEVDVYDGAARAMGYRKTAIAEVVVREGSGKFTVNDRSLLDYFYVINDREQIMFPLLVVGELNRFDIEAHVIGGGQSGKSGAIRLAMSRAIAALCPEHFEALNNAKLLIRDYREKERKKPGRKRARRAFQWVKR